MIRKVLISAVASGLIVGAAAQPASATTDYDGPVTLTVPAVQVYHAECDYFPFEVSLTAGPNILAYASIPVEATRPGAWGATKPLSALAEGDTGRIEEWMYLCLDTSGVGTFTYSASVVGDEYLKNEDHWLRSFHARVQVTTVLKTPSDVTQFVSTTRPKKNKKIVVKGHAGYRDANWSYRNVNRQNVTLQFKRSGSSSWTKVKTAKTTSSGNYSFKVKAERDGWYRLAYSGYGTVAGSASTPVYVNVK